MPDPLWINASGGAPAYAANEMRQAMALALMFDGRLVGGRQGVRPGGNQLKVSLSVSTITVQPGLACIDPALSTPQGSYWVAIPTAETHTLTPADATNPRKDIVILRVYDHDEDASGLRLARSEYLAGTANPSPAEPAVPAGAMRLATIDVPASPGVAAVTDRRTWTVAPGGILPVAGASDIAAGIAGRYRDRGDTGLLERDNGSAWVPIANPLDFFPNVEATNALYVGAGNTTTSSSYADIGSGNFTFVKKRADTKLKVELYCSAFCTGSNSTAMFALQINGVDYDCGRIAFNALSAYTNGAGVSKTGTFAAGSYTVKPRWKRVSGSGTIAIDGAGWLSASVTEIYPT